MSKSIEEYAVDPVADGAESFAEDDLNEDGEIDGDDAHREACDLACSIAHVIRGNGAAFLAWYGSIKPAAPGGA